MINWKEIYEKTLRNICEENENYFNNIVELERPEFQGDLIKNPNAKGNSLFVLMLDNNATDEDYKKFVEYIYGYIGEDINDYINNEENPKTESEDTEMEAEQIRNLLKLYGK